MKIMTNKKFNEILKEERIRVLDSALKEGRKEGIKSTEEKYNSTLEGIVAENKLKDNKIKQLEKINFDLDGKNQELSLELENEKKEIKELEEKLNLANKEIEALKVNVKINILANAKKTASKTISETKANKKSTKKEVNKTAEESKEKKSTRKLKSNTPDKHIILHMDDLSKDVDTKKNEELFENYKETKKKKNKEKLIIGDSKNLDIIANLVKPKKTTKNKKENTATKDTKKKITKGRKSNVAN